MLVLSRKVGDKIYIGDDVEIVIIDIPEKNKVRIGIQAPRNVSIMRAELVPDKKPGDKLVSPEKNYRDKKLGVVEADTFGVGVDVEERHEKSA